MIQRGFERKARDKDWKIDKQWKSFLDEISDPMKRAAVAAEDQSFLENHGFDFNAIEKALSKKTRIVKSSSVAAPYRSKPLKMFFYGRAGLL